MIYTSPLFMLLPHLLVHRLHLVVSLQLFSVLLSFCVPGDAKCFLLSFSRSTPFPAWSQFYRPKFAGIAFALTAKTDLACRFYHPGLQLSFVPTRIKLSYRPTFQPW